MSFLEIEVTFKDQEEAEKMTDKLLAAKLVACVNLFPAESKYWWKGKLEKASEILGVLKTSQDNWPEVRQTIESLHSYEVPAIIKTEVESSEAYDSWVHSETNK